MRRWGLVLVGTVELCLVAVAGGGCAAIIWADQRSTGLDAPAESVFPIGSSGQEIDTRLGKPASSRALPDGGRVGTYKYARRPVERPFGSQGTMVPGNTSEAVASVLLSVMTLGVTDIPAYLELSKNRRSVTFTFDANDRLLSHGPPPTYGSSGDAVGSLSLNEIGERCRSEVSGDPPGLPGGVTGGRLTAPRDLYYKCLVRRLAIWGIE